MKKFLLLIIILLVVFTSAGFGAYYPMISTHYDKSTNITNPQWERTNYFTRATWDATLSDNGDSSVVWIPIDKGFKEASISYSAYSIKDSVYVSSYYGYSTTMGTGAIIHRVEMFQDSLIYWYKAERHIVLKKPSWVYPRGYLVIVTRGTSKNPVTISHELEVFIKDDD